MIKGKNQNKDNQLPEVLLDTRVHVKRAQEQSHMDVHDVTLLMKVIMPSPSVTKANKQTSNDFRKNNVDCIEDQDKARLGT